jgi:hypothetical protein
MTTRRVDRKPPRWDLLAQRAYKKRHAEIFRRKTFMALAHNSPIHAYYLEEIAKLSDKEILRIPGIGKKGLALLRNETEEFWEKEEDE